MILRQLSLKKPLSDIEKDNCLKTLKCFKILQRISDLEKIYFKI